MRIHPFLVAILALPALAASAHADSSRTGALDEAMDEASMAAAAPVSGPAEAAATPSPTAEPTAEPAAAPGSPSWSQYNTQDTLEAQLARLENAYDDQQASIRQLESALDDVRAAANAANSGAPASGAGTGMFLAKASDYEYNPAADQEEQVTMFAWNRFHLYVNTDIEYTSQYDDNPDKKGGEDIGTGETPDFILPDTPNGSEGFFFKHMDIHLGYDFNQNMFAKLDYNLAAVEIDDCGVGWRNLPFPPLTSGWGDVTYEIFVGQRRQSFGIEQQTDSENTMFPDRAMMYGGKNPFGNAATPTEDPFELYDPSSDSAASNNLIAELVYERTMGVHLFSKGDFRWIGYTLGMDVVNDESESSVDGGGTDSLSSGFPLQYAGDQDPSEIGRLGLDPEIMNDYLPWGLKLKVGGSAFHDSENTAYYASQPSQINWADCYGADAMLQSMRDIVYMQAEYVHREQFGPGFTGAGENTDTFDGMQGAAEAYYVALSFQPWRIFDPNAPRLELEGRYESYRYEDLQPWLQASLTPYRGSYNAITLCAKYTYMGNCHTAVEYITYGLNNDFNAAGPTELLHIEQQVDF